MNREHQLRIFQAQVLNVKELDTAWRHLKRSIHADLVSDQQSSARIHTKTLALVYCAWSEAVLSKLVHTPHGFDLSEIEQIKSAQHSSIVNAWKKCIELAAAKVGKQTGSYVPNIRKRLEKLVRTYIEDPSLVRNKVAHGQWRVALNRENTEINATISQQIEALNVVQLDIWREAFLGLSEIVEAMIESPDRTFHRDYPKILARIEEHLEKTSGYSLDDKVAQLKLKASRQEFQRKHA
ncbi:hypothetical protein [Peristeroidobacter agariperforans]|uniref:hypothetical protein n=1 Tax=Peristeroidobacter agariperforans TaxID=268404 RepID=UPI00101C75E7|nr:hypothetical protein [Peristeroidobacter agariperforans]